MAAKYTALGPAPALHDAFVSYRLFPNSEIARPHSPSVSRRTIGRSVQQSQFYDLGMSPTCRAAKNGPPQGSPRFSVRNWSAIAKPECASRLRTEWPERSGRPHRIEKPADLELEAIGITRQRLRRRKYLRGCRSGFAGATLHVGNVGRNLLGTLGG